LASDIRVWNIIKEELLKIKEKYQEPRRTLIEKEKTSEVEFKPEDLIEKEGIVVTVTSNGYIKYTPLRAYRRQKRGGRGMSGITLQKGDLANNLVLCNTHSTLFFFTNSGKVRSIKAYEIPERKRGERGRAIVNFLPIGEGEKITEVIPVDDFTPNRFLLMVTKRGLVKKTSMSRYLQIKRGGIIAVNLKENDELIRVLNSSGEDEIVLSTRKGMAIRFSEDDVRETGRASMGVRGISLNKDDEVIDATIVDPEADLFVITTKGYGKRTPFAEYRKIRRGGKGVKNINLHAGKGEVVATKKIKEDDEVIIITKKGKIIRLWAKNIRKTGRCALGTRIIKLDEDDEVRAVT